MYSISSTIAIFFVAILIGIIPTQLLAAEIQSCGKESIRTGQTLKGTGSEILLRTGPSEKFEKIINQKASSLVGKTWFISIDKSVTVYEECTQSGWSKIRVTEPEWLRESHRGWVPSKALRRQNLDSAVKGIEHVKATKYTIIHTITTQRYDGGVTYYVLIDPIDLKNDKFKDNIKSIIRDIVKKKGGKITIEFHDKIESLNISYKQYGDMSLKRPRNQREEEIEAVHFIAAFSGQLKTYAYFNTLDFFTVAFSDHPIVGKYGEQIEFNP